MNNILNEDIFRENMKFTVENEKYIFKKMKMDEISDSLDKLKNKLKKFAKVYSKLIEIISPVYIDNNIYRFLDKCSENQIIINIGSGNTNLSDKVSNIDIFAYDNVDVVCDIENLPFKDNSIDVVLNIAVLEHVPNPSKVIAEIYRVLKKDGLVYTAFPFIQGFHASPYDFTRVTQEGMKILHQQFEQLELKPFGGPTSGMLWVFQEWIAILFSFGNKKLHMYIYLIVMIITSPLKYLDYFLIKHPMAKNISSGFSYIGKKSIC